MRTDNQTLCFSRAPNTEHVQEIDVTNMSLSTVQHITQIPEISSENLNSWWLRSRCSSDPHSGSFNFHSSCPPVPPLKLPHPLGPTGLQNLTCGSLLCLFGPEEPFFSRQPVTVTRGAPPSRSVTRRTVGVCAWRAWPDRAVTPVLVVSLEHSQSVDAATSASLTGMTSSVR